MEYYEESIIGHITDGNKKRTKRKTKRKTRRKTKRNSKKEQLFNKYSKNKKDLTKSECIQLIKNEYKLNYSDNIIVSFMNIWGKKRNGNYVIMKETFPKLFKPPDGFLRDHR